MPDREKIVKGLKCCRNTFCPFDDCPYYGEMNCEENVCSDAFDLLNEREENPALDEVGRCLLNALKRQLDMKLQIIEMLITPEFAEKIVQIMEKAFMD